MIVKRTLIALLLAAGSAHAAKVNGVDCEAVGKAGYTVLAAHSVASQSTTNEKLMTKSLVTYCSIGVGNFMLGKNLNEAVHGAAEAISITSNDPTNTAILMSMTAQGFLLASAHSLEEETKK